MKKAKKVVALALCAVMLVVGSVAGTMAYLTSQDAVTNTFTVGNVAITLDEADVKTDGTYEKDATVRVDANEYHLVPGHTYIKDPIIHVDSKSENSYLFVKVVNQISGVEAATTDSYNNIVAQMAANGWVRVDGAENVYVYTDPDNTTDEKAIVTPGQDVSVFEEFKLADNADLTTYTATDGKITETITVAAFAVQADGFTEKTPAQIWSTAGFTNV